ncbi:hypothetical protein [Nitrosopumilus sp.]|uniref:hypothetical protein n=1 Tax=Nitrosopumilus sp. TaxID=2024843 RepID=UPI00292FA29E|nr:hypothetical protein [Nitrosopumilus sp.]
MSCKGICPRYKSKRRGKGLRYANGEKRCQKCDIFLDWKGIHCPCCGYKLRTRPHNKKYEEIMRNHG